MPGTPTLSGRSAKAFRRSTGCGRVLRVCSCAAPCADGAELAVDHAADGALAVEVLAHQQRGIGRVHGIGVDLRPSLAVAEDHFPAERPGFAQGLPELPYEHGG